MRTEEADSITSLTLQDVGLVMPGGRSGNLLIQGGRQFGEITWFRGYVVSVRVKLVGLPYQVKAYVVIVYMYEVLYVYVLLASTL